MNDFICRIKYFLEDHRITLPKITCCRSGSGCCGDIPRDILHLKDGL